MGWVGVADRNADVVTDDVDAVDPELSHQLMEVLRHGRGVVGALRTAHAPAPRRSGTITV